MRAWFAGHPGERSARKLGLAASCEALEARQLLAAEAFFIGVTAPNNSVQDLVTFNSNSPSTSYKDLGALSGIAPNYVMEALSRDPSSNILYGFAVNNSGSGQLYRVDPVANSVTALGSPLQASFTQIQNGFFAAGGIETVYKDSKAYQFDPNGVQTHTFTTTGGTPVAQTPQIDGNSSSIGYGIDLTTRSINTNGSGFTNSPYSGQTISTRTGLQVAGNFGGRSEYLTGTFTVNSTDEYDLMSYDLVANTTTKVATLPQVLNGLADRIVTPTLHVSGVSGSIIAGSTQTITVTADPGDGSIDTGYTGTVHLTSSDPQATLPPDATLTNGTGTFQVTLKTAGTRSITATDTVNTTDTGSLGGIIVDPAGLSRFVVTGPTTAIAGTANTYAFVGFDPFGNQATGYTGTVHVTSSDPQATLPVDMRVSSGAGVFSATLKTAGSRTITVSDLIDDTVTGTTPAVAVAAAGLDHLALDLAATGTAGVEQTLGITGYDPFNNVATGSNATLILASSDGRANLPSSVALASGVASVEFLPGTAGTQSVTVTDAAVPSITRSASTRVAAAAATRFVVTGAAGGVAGSTESITVTALDDFGNTAAGYAGTVHFSSTDPGATLPADATLTNGTGTFTAKLVRAGSNSISASDTAAPAIIGTQAGIMIIPGLAAALAITGPSSVVVGGKASSYTITALDQYGNTATGDAATVQLSSSDPAATLPASATLIAGVGMVSVTLATPGSQTIRAVDSATPTIAGTSPPIAVQPQTGGTVFLDTNANGVQDPGEPGMADRSLFLDTHGTGSFVLGDPTTTTDANGHFAFPGVAAGSTGVLQLLSQDVNNRYAVSQFATNADSSLSIGVVPFSPIVPIVITPNPFVGNPGTDTSSRYVQALYRSVLGRTGGAAEVALWTTKLAAGATPAQVAAGFVNSAEHRIDEVDSYYRSFLHRAADPSSIHWVNMLLGGVAEQTVVEAFLDSPEYQAEHADPSLYVHDLYLDVLGRRGGDSEVAAWEARLSSGTSRAAVTAAFVTSTEANDQVVESFYVAELHRPSDPSSSYWTDQLAQGIPAGTVQVSILSSAEFLAKSRNSTAS